LKRTADGRRQYLNYDKTAQEHLFSCDEVIWFWNGINWHQIGK